MGQREEVYQIGKFEDNFPNLHFRPYYLKSPYNPAYNCLAFAVDREDLFMNASEVKGYHWPPGMRQNSMQAWVEIIESYGFALCENGDHEIGFEKVALYADADGIPQHAAKQRRNGMWASKMGNWEDIEYPHLDALNGEAYGIPVKFFKKHRPEWTSENDT